MRKPIQVEKAMKLSVIPNYLDISTQGFKAEAMDAAVHGKRGHVEAAAKTMVESIELLTPQHKERRATEQYIARKFEDVHQAHIQHFLPYLIRITHSDEPAAAVGIQPGDQGEMFLEQYLSSPVEQQIAALEKQPVSRDQIVEIGNLVVSYKPAGFMLFLIIASALARAGFKWMTFTATPVVEKMIQRLGYSPFYLAEATADCLGEAAREWGQYYAKHPRVMVGNLDDAQAHIQSCPILGRLVSPFQKDIRQLATNITRNMYRG
jgi:AraC-like DNA-binding protein